MEIDSYKNFFKIFEFVIYIKICWFELGCIVVVYLVGVVELRLISFLFLGSRGRIIIG